MTDTNEVVDVLDETGDVEDPATIYSITSYGADYPVELVPKRVRTEQWYAPNFQRNFVWSQKMASRFIESLLLGLPVPGIFLYKEPDGKHLIIDGKQRLTSLQLFMDGDDFGKRKFRLSGVDDQFEGRSFEELEREDRTRLEEAIVHATIFTQNNPEDNYDSVYSVFERINTGGSKLSAQEIRSCINHNGFSDVLEELANTECWKKVFRIENKRLKDHELILRMFSFLYNLSGYDSPMKKFLDSQMAHFDCQSSDRHDEMSAHFIEAITFIGDNVEDRVFRPERIFNAAVFDSVSAVTAKGLIEGSLKPNYAENYNALLANANYIELCSRSTADVERVRARFDAADNALCD
jgi:hypothetical protein